MGLIYLYFYTYANSFRGTAQQSVDLNPLYFFLSVETLKVPTAFSPNSKWRDTLPTHFWCLSNYLQSGRDLWKFATNWRTFWAFYVTRDLLHTKNSAVIRLGTCTVNILCQLQVKYYINKVAFLIWSFKWVKYTLFGHMFMLLFPSFW